MLTHLDGLVTIQRGGIYRVDPTVHELEPYYNQEYKIRLGLFLALGHGVVRVVGILNEDTVLVVPINTVPGFVNQLPVKKQAIVGV